MTRISPTQANEILGLASDCRVFLQAHDPAMYERLIHGGLYGIPHDEANDIAHQLYALRARLGLGPGGIPRGENACAPGR